MLAIRTILCPTDLSERSQRAFAVACALARDQGARLVFLHVLPPIEAGGPSGRGAGEGLKAFRDEMTARFKSILAPDLGVQLEHQVREGDATEEILRAAEESRCDLIVMGTQGKTAEAGRLMGSVAEAVSRRAPCLVLTLSPKR